MGGNKQWKKPEPEPQEVRKVSYSTGILFLFKTSKRVLSFNWIQAVLKRKIFKILHNKKQQ
jgi:hypothetical protein